MSRQDHKQQVASNLCKLSNCYITLAGRLKFKLNFQQRSEISALLGHLWFELNIRATEIIPLPSNSFVAMVTPPFLYLILMHRRVQQKGFTLSSFAHGYIQSRGLSVQIRPCSILCTVCQMISIIGLLFTTLRL